MPSRWSTFLASPPLPPRQRPEADQRRRALTRQAGRDDTSDAAIGAKFGLPVAPVMVAPGFSAYKCAHLLRGALGPYLRVPLPDRHRGDILVIA